MDHASESITSPPDAEPGPMAAPPEALEALSAGIERGHHLALVAAEGAGLGRLYAAAAARDLAKAPGGRALVLAATDERARRLGRTIHETLGETGLETIAWGPRTVAAGDIVIGTPARLLTDLRAGRLSLADVRLLALDDVRALEPDEAAVEALLQLAGDETRLIAVTHARDEAFDDLLVRRLSRARRWPAELFEPADERPAASGPPLRIGSAPTAERRIERAIELLHDMAETGRVDRVVVWCARAAETDAVRAALAVEGFELGDDDAGVRVAALGVDVAAEGAAAILLGLPSRAADCERALATSDRRSAIVAPRYVRQLELLADRLGWAHRGLGERATAHADEISRFRSLVEEAVGRLDLAGSMLLIEPLVERHGFHAVSAALAGLLRETGRLPAPSEPEAARAGAGSDAARAARPTWTRVFVNVGKQDGAAPGDFVGAITGETGAAAAQIGKIEIRPRFSLIDIDSMIVDDVIRGLNKARIKGRDVAARLDRGG